MTNYNINQIGQWFISNQNNKTMMAEVEITDRYGKDNTSALLSYDANTNNFILQSSNVHEILKHDSVLIPSYILSSFNSEMIDKVIELKLNDNISWDDAAFKLMPIGDNKKLSQDSQEVYEQNIADAEQTEGISTQSNDAQVIKTCQQCKQQYNASYPDYYNLCPTCKENDIAKLVNLKL